MLGNRELDAEPEVVAGPDPVDRLVEDPFARGGLQLALMGLVELPARIVEGDEELSQRFGCQDLDRKVRAGEALGARRQVQVVRPVTWLARLLVGDVDGPEHVVHLVVVVGHDRLRQRDQVGSKLLEPRAERRMPGVPVSTASPQVLRHDSGTGGHVAECCRLQSEPLDGA